jgi:hypothetical protein
MSMLYRIYSVDDQGHVAGPAQEVECESDEHAIDLAKRKRMRDGKSVEVWQLERKVAELK